MVNRHRTKSNVNHIPVEDTPKMVQSSDALPSEASEYGLRYASVATTSWEVKRTAYIGRT